MEIKFRERFEKDIDEISDQKILDSIVRTIENVIRAQTPKHILNIKKIKADKSAFRIRIGRYRIGIYIIKGVAEFTRVLPRDKIYRYFPD